MVGWFVDGKVSAACWVATDEMLAVGGISTLVGILKELSAIVGVGGSAVVCGDCWRLPERLEDEASAALAVP
jgi:hypothetical protein